VRRETPNPNVGRLVLGFAALTSTYLVMQDAHCAPLEDGA
jgi:hypothetical protein